MDTFDIGSIKHSCGICIDFINEFIKSNMRCETMNKRAKHTLNVTEICMMSPAPSHEVTKQTYDMWFEFYEWIRCRVQDIVDMEDFDNLDLFMETCSIGMNKYNWLPKIFTISKDLN